MTQKYVKGVKRNQIIQRWLQGIDDPDYDVFPTKKEGKYIVKLKQSSSSEPSVNNSNIPPQTEPIVSDSQSELHVIPNGNFVQQMKPPINESTEELEPVTTTRKPPLTRKPTFATRTYESQTVNGINLEILEQLRNLGEEIRNDRFKKEQKQYIKHIVNKELSKSRIRSKYVPDIFVNDTTVNEPPNELPTNNTTVNDTTVNEPPNELPTNDTTVNDISVNEPVQPIFRSRIRR